MAFVGRWSISRLALLGNVGRRGEGSLLLLAYLSVLEEEQEEEQGRDTCHLRCWTPAPWLQMEPGPEERRLKEAEPRIPGRPGF